MSANSKNKRRGVFLVGSILIIGWILAPVFIKALVYRVVDVFHSPAQNAASTMGRVQDYWALRTLRRNDLIKQYRELSRENAALRLENRQASTIDNYVNRLEHLLGLHPVPGFKIQNARVIRREINSWLQEIHINKGSEDGIAEGLAVVVAEGLVGRIIFVKAHTSVVSLVTSPSFRITVNSANDDRPIAFQGRGQSIWSPLVAEASHIPHDLNALDESSFPVFTTGLGDSLPAGIKVGEITDTEHEVEGLFSKGIVRLNDKLRFLKEVAVLIPLKQGN